MSGPIILVAGLGRCGSSLTMQMLHAAGVPCVGTWPDFEVDQMRHLPHDAEGWTAMARGKAVKALDPHKWTPPAGPDYRLIYLSRKPLEQAKSMLKLAGQSQNRQARRAMEQSVRRDNPLAVKALAQIMGPGARQRSLFLHFESIIHAPEVVASIIARFLYEPLQRPLDVDRMAACVRKRPPTCLPFMMERELACG